MSIVDVAKLAGVSSSTVSRVINDDPRVAIQTAQTVRRAMRKLNYTPSDRRPGPKPGSRTARANVAFLVLGTSGDCSTPGFEGLLRGVSAGAWANNLNLTFNFVPDVEHLPLRALERGIDGLLLHGALPGPDLRMHLERLPAVWLMGNRCRPDWGDQVMPNSYTIGELAANHLVGRGHRNLAFLGVGTRSSWFMRVRAMAFEHFARDAGAEEVLILDGAAEHAMWNDYWRGDGLAHCVPAMLDRLLSHSPRPSGMFVAEDRLMPHVDAALAERGLNADGGDGDARIELISCNNERAYLLGLRTVPAEIDIHVDLIGRRGIEQLLWRLRNPSAPDRVCAMIEPSLLDPSSLRSGN